MDSTSASFSIEFYPPRTTEGESKLDAVHAELSALGPEYFSVTYGAGGTTRAGTSKLVLKYQTAGSEVAPH
ncbi:MAG: methylenetetrahydrofolate reductase, partial [Pseudomonadota bacterium]|nr:methylenetetrahydrofolate reductase [Pseudomonadota bacterium]